MKAKRGFILMNTGAPSSTQEVDHRRYLKEVSKDHHVTDLASMADTVVHNHRAARSVSAYKQVWREDGAPLIHACKKIRNTLRRQQDAPVEIGMLYGEPSVMRAVGKLLDTGIEELCILPLFPQYSVETFQGCIDKVEEELRQRKSRILLRKAPPFYSHPDYVRPWAEALADAAEHVLFSYRGLSLHHLTKPDKRGHCLSSATCCCEASGAHDTCYRFQCLKTTRLIVSGARLPDTGYSISYDSHHGTAKCIEPYTQDTLQALPEQGHPRVVVVCPSHFCDSVETLEEIDVRGRQHFMEAGGESFRMIQGLNDSTAGIACLESLMHSANDWRPV